ncbi:MAG: sugar phosphate isomerase/epimerase [Acidobacteriaceae bacterium]|nr:sugar phosphate isomerase/epimerase [Acidobacteriaceae bacterium]
MTRRAFGQLAAASLTASAAGFHLNIGVGAFSYHLLSLDEMIRELQANRIREIEMSRGEFMLMKPPTQEMVETARRKFDNAGIRCVSYYTATIKNQEDLDYALRYAKIFGAANVSGDATGPILKEIDRQFTQAGLTFGIHNHWFPRGFAYESAEDVLRAITPLSSTVGSTLDTGQVAACGYDPVDAIRRLRSRLNLVHLKDVEAAGAERNVPLGTGVAQIPAAMRELKEFGFSRLVAIEFEKDTNDNQDMREQIAYARKLA